MKLTDMDIRAWVATKPDNGTLFDGKGLHLQIRNGGAPIWRIKYRYDGVERLHTLPRTNTCLWPRRVTHCRLTQNAT